MSIFTPEDLLLYIYKETSPEQTLAIQNALTTDWVLQEKFKVIQASVGQLDTELCAPRTEIVLNVLNYARETMAETIA